MFPKGKAKHAITLDVSNDVFPNNPTFHKNLAEGLEFINQIADLPEPLKVSVKENHDGRAHAGVALISMEENNDPWVTVHELGHCIEAMQRKRLGRLAQAFAQDKIQQHGQEVKRYPKELGYKDYEIGAKNGFLEGYTGKFYSDGFSEVISMGAQHLFEDPERFYKESRDHFDFTVAALKGWI